jgi:ESCRT-II complex subunit VPS36
VADNLVQSDQHSSSGQLTKIRCPRCTFANHPSLQQCELCGASLAPASDPRLDLSRHEIRAVSPGPTLIDLTLDGDSTASIRLSFRAGGEKIFHERLKAALQQRKWLLQGAPPAPKPREEDGDGSAQKAQPRKLVGIASLEMRGQTQRKNNEQIIGNAFEDLEALMTSAKEIIALAESFSAQAREGNASGAEVDSLLTQSASALGLTTTKDMLGSDSLYVSELSRNLAEYLTDDSTGVLRREGGIMSLVDLWAVFNRSRNGVELVNPVDFEKAAQMWEQLKLPIRLRRFKSGLLVVQERSRTDEKTIESILAWLQDLHSQPPLEGATWDWQRYGRGVTVQEAVVRFGWSMGIATEELDMAEEKGVLCREQGLDGVRFWENWLSGPMTKSM